MQTLGSYVRGTATVAAVDAVGILIGLLILQVPLAIPLAVLVFLLAFFLDFFELAFIIVPLLAPAADALGIDLIWFGGIGTYVKAASENNATVGDPANDRLRVNAEDLRAVAIGEGANLGVTQAARIAFAARGGRINTDFIDNSAGVDCSDNEVNIKIALASAKRAGRLTEDGRVALLGRMTDEVARLVLEDNRLQALALSIAERGGAGAMAGRGLTSTVETGSRAGRGPGSG